MALGVPGRLRPRIFSTFGTTRVVARQPNVPATFTPGEILGTHFPQGTWFCRKEPRKKSQVTPRGIDPGTVRLVAQRLNHYATPGPIPQNALQYEIYKKIFNFYCSCLIYSPFPFDHTQEFSPFQVTFITDCHTEHLGTANRRRDLGRKREQHL